MANLSGAGIIEGINKFEGGQAAFAAKSGVKRQTVNGLITSREGLSLPAARKIVKTLPGSADPYALYVASQVAAVKREDPVPEEVLRRVTVVAKTLRANGDLGESEDLKAALGELTRLNSDAMARTTGTMETLGRRPDGTATKKRQDRDAGEEVATKNDSGGQMAKLGRRPDGTSSTKKHVL